MTEIVKKHSAGGLLFDKNNVLLIHWDPPRSSYDYPKGTIDPNETPEQACVREVLEETGFNTKIVEFIGQTHYEYDWIDGTHHEKTVDYFLLENTNISELVPKRELHETFQNVWLSVDRAMELLTRDIDKEILTKALALIKL
jgi:8-oxo-dGTP pyrophosphatase MutT (NUDIX family)